MNPQPHVNPRSVTSGLFTGNWKGLDKTTRWVFLGKWDQADETLFLEMRETRPNLKPRPHFAKANPAFQREAEANRKARKEARLKEREERANRRAAKFAKDSKANK